MSSADQVPPKPLEVGDPVRVLRGVAKPYRGHTYTVRKLQEHGEIMVDNGDPHGPDAMTNGAEVMLVARPHELERWSGTPRFTIPARLAGELREARAEIDRLRARVAELEERADRLWKCAAEAVIAQGSGSETEAAPTTGGHDPGDEYNGGARVAECVGLRHANCVAGAAGSDPGYDEVCEIYGHRPDFVVVWRIDGRVLIGDTPRTAMPLGTALGAAAWAAATKSGCVQRKGVP